jgi:hypothetical protein
MRQELLIHAVAAGLLIGGCASGPHNDAGWAHRPPDTSDPGPSPTPPEWIAAGAVAKTGPPPQSPPPSESREPEPPKEETWASKAMEKGKHAVKEAARMTGAFVAGTLLVGAVLGVVVLYAAAAGNSNNVLK